MAKLIDQPLSAFLSPEQADRLGPEGEAVVARIAQMAASISLTMGRTELLSALSASTPAAFLSVLAERMAGASAPSLSALETLRGRIALAEAVERTGGLWRADEAQRELDVSRATLQSWRDGGRVLALPLGDGSYGYPIVQFVRPSSDLESPRPHPDLVKILGAAGEALQVPELFQVLAAPQPTLADSAGRARTGFEAMHGGEADLVAAMIAHLVTPADAGAPPMEEPMSTVSYARAY
jgi:hypothetical protein